MLIRNLALIVSVIICVGSIVEANVLQKKLPEADLYSQTDVEALSFQFVQGSPPVFYNVPPGQVDQEILIINDLKKIAKDDHVIQSIVGNEVWTLLPLRDKILNEQRSKAFETSIKVGKKVVGEWLLEAAKQRGLVKNDKEATALLEALNIIETKSDEEITAYINEHKLKPMPTKADIIDRVQGGMAIRDSQNRKAEYVTEIEALIREIDSKENTFKMPDNSSFSLQGLYKNVTTPSAYIFTAGIKLPKSNMGPQNNIFSSSGVVGPLGNLFVRSVQIIYKLLSGNSVTFTSINRPWAKHVRNLDTNEITVSTSDPSTWHWEKSAQVWVQIDEMFKKNKKAPVAPFMGPFLEGKGPTLLPFPKYRVGGGFLWARDMKTLAEIKGGFVGGSFTVTAKNQVNRYKPISGNVKVGVVLPMENITSGSIPKLFDYVYAMAFIQKGVQVSKAIKATTNVGYIMSLSEMFNAQPVFTQPYPVQTQPGSVGTPGNPGGGPIGIFPQPRDDSRLNPPIGFMPREQETIISPPK